MSQRTFFNLRHAFPGYTFILLTILINLRILGFLFLTYIPKIDTLNITTLLGIFFGFLTIMSGTPFGFLISQCWHVVYAYVWGDHYGKYGVSRPYRELNDKCKIRNEKECLTTVYNYIVHSCPEKRIHSYLNRRWDLLMLFGSTGTGIALGLVSWCIVRFIEYLELLELQQITELWIIYEGAIITVSVVLLFLLILSFRNVRKEHDSMSIFLIRRASENLYDYKIPREYFEK